MIRVLPVLLCAFLISGCAGMGAPYDSPADANQIPFRVEPVTPRLLERLSVELPKAALAPASDPSATQDYVYRIGAADILSVSVNEAPTERSFAPQDAAAPPSEQSPLLVVNERGEIFLPLHGPLAVEGLTVSEAYERILNALSRFITNPQINVRVAEFRSQRVTVATPSGEGQFLPITDQPLSIVDAILQVGGDPELADLRSVILKRGGRDTIVDARALMASPGFGHDWLLRDGDIVVVPENREAVYVVGEAPTRRTAIVPYQTTLAEVLLDRQPGGSARLQNFLIEGSALASRIFILRGDTAFVDVYHLNAKSPDAIILADRFLMQSGDVVYVSTNPVTRFNRFVSETLPSLAPLLAAGAIAD